MAQTEPFSTTLRKHPHTIIPFALMHLAVIGLFFVPFRWPLVALCFATYAIRVFGVGAGYHRYFSHRSYKLNRLNQFLMAFLAESSAQKGILWWAANHRDHHQNSDKVTDVHSPVQHGFWWSHVGWIVSDEYDTYDPARIRDFEKFPELRWLNKYHLVPPIILGAAIFLLGGVSAFFWGFVLSTVLLYHATFSINSLSHVWGKQRFATGDQSRNNWVLALITGGEGWHNNHHYYMASARQGILWWEIDWTYYTLKLLSWLRFARDLRPFRWLSETEPAESTAAADRTLAQASRYDAVRF